MDRMRIRTFPAAFGERDGSAIILVVVYLAVLTLMAGAFLTALRSTMRETHVAERREKSLHIAEGGLDKAVVMLQRSPDRYRGEIDSVLGEGFFTTTVESVEGSRVYRVVSSARFGEGLSRGSRVTIVAEVGLSVAGALERLEWFEVRER